MKRKRDMYGGETIFATPNVESTFCVEVEHNKIGSTVSNQNFGEIGKIPSIELNHSISTNVQKFIYNDFFWGDDLFTFNYTNCGAGLAIAYLYRNPSIPNTTRANFSFIIYPIFLPRITLAALQSSFASGVSGRPLVVLLLKSLVYYLNVGFTSLNIAPDGVNGTNYPVFKYSSNNTTGVPDYYYLPQWVAAQDAKGPLYERQPPNVYVTDCKQMPIFQTTRAPPLLWFVDEANLKIGIRINPNFSNFGTADPATTCYIGVQLISLEKYFCDATLVATGSKVTEKYMQADLFYSNYGLSGPSNVNVTSAFGETAGWFNNGVFATGFGYSSSKYDPVSGDLIKVAGEYGDIYTDDERRQLWRYTLFPDSANGGMTPFRFGEFCDQFRLVHNVGNSSVLGVLSPKCPWFIPSRFLLVKSNLLSQTQKRAIVSNNKTITSNTIGIHFLSVDGKRKWKDETASGNRKLAKYNPSENVFSKTTVSDVTVVSLDPLKSIQTFDLTFSDEWGSNIQNFGAVNNLPIRQTKIAFYKLFEWESVIPNSWVYPVWLTSLYPYSPDIGLKSSIFVDQNWFASVYMFMSIKNSSELSPYLLDDTFQPQMTEGSNMIHFGRMLGY